jgi:hypothetical protein
MMNGWSCYAPEGCVCYTPEDLKAGWYCVCGDEEKVLRAYLGSSSMPPMTAKQREECLEEIASVEGYDRKDYETESDANLARGVLHAWTSYCHDKGLL